MESKINRIYLFIGILSLILAVFDFGLESDLFGGILTTAWGLFFIFLGVKNFISARYEPRMIGGIHAVLIIYIVIAGLTKVVMKLLTR